MERVWRAGIFALIFFSTQAGAVVAEPSLRASLITSVGRQTDADFPRPSVTFEPWLVWRATTATTLRFRALLDRPFDPYKNWQAPSMEILGVWLVNQSGSFDWGWVAQTAGQDIDKWAGEGFQLRQMAGAIARWQPASGLQLELVVGPYVAGNEYTQLRKGEYFSIAGALQQLTVSYQRGLAKLEVLGLCVQDWNGRWRNYYSMTERVSLRLWEGFSVGVSHTLAWSQIDEATGLVAPVGFFDGRKSRLAGFVQWQI